MKILIGTEKIHNVMEIEKQQKILDFSQTSVNEMFFFGNILF